jgi:hypothetical protein
MKSFTELAKGIADLVTEKEKAYGSAFDKAGDFLRVLYPEGIKPEQYKDMLCIVRVFDKLMRIATSYEGTEEKKVDAYSDLMGYGLLGLRASLAEKQSTQEQSTQEQSTQEQSTQETEKEVAFCNEGETPPEETLRARWEALAFPQPGPSIGEELARQLRVQNEKDFLRGSNRPKINPNTPACDLKRHNEYPRDGVTHAHSK